MKFKFTDEQIPQKIKTKDFHKNAWVAPDGTFYGFDGAKHNFFAAWIAIFEEGGKEGDLKRGEYFKEIWDDWLKEKGYLEIKDTSWLGGDLTRIFCKKLTQKQRDVLWDYCEEYGVDYRKLIGERA